jgi:hypothetical protein
LSQEASLALLGQVADGAYRLEAMSAGDVGAAVAVIDRYRDLELGLADASIVVLADRYDVSDVLTLDERHFRAVRRSDGRPFRVRPADQ